MNKKRLLYSFGGIATVLGSLTTLVACSRQKDNPDTTMIKNFFDKSLPEVLKKIDKKKSIFDLENIALKSQITDFKTIFGHDLPALPKFENNLDNEFGVFLTKRSEKQAELLFKLTLGIKKPEATKEVIKSFKFNLKELTVEEKKQELSKLITDYIGDKSFETSLNEKLVSDLQKEEVIVTLEDLGIQSHFEQLKDKNVKITGKITKKFLDDEKVNVTLSFEKFGVIQEEAIIVTGFKNKQKSENEKTLNEVKEKIAKNEKELKYNATFASLAIESPLGINEFTDEISKEIVKNYKEVSIELKVTQKTADDLTVEIKLSKGSNKTAAVIPSFTIKMLKTQFKP